MTKTKCHVSLVDNKVMQFFHIHCLFINFVDYGNDWKIDLKNVLLLIFFNYMQVTINTQDMTADK